VLSEERRGFCVAFVAGEWDGEKWADFGRFCAQKWGFWGKIGPKTGENGHFCLLVK
jgi:hypothetical protein